MFDRLIYSAQCIPMDCQLSWVTCRFSPVTSDVSFRNGTTENLSLSKVMGTPNCEIFWWLFFLAKISAFHLPARIHLLLSAFAKVMTPHYLSVDLTSWKWWMFENYAVNNSKTQENDSHPSLRSQKRVQNGILYYGKSLLGPIKF